MAVYIEYVLIDNFVIDYLLLKATFTLTGNGYKKGRLFLCAILGGIFALVYPLINTHAILITLIKILFGILLMLLATNYRSAKNFYVNTLVFFAMTFLTGGAVIGIYSLLGLDYSKEYSIALMVLPVFLLIQGLTAVVKHIYRRKDIAILIFDCEIAVGESKLKVKGFTDTGNGLYDGDSPVIICGKKTIKKLFSGLKEIPKIYRLNFSTVSGKDDMLAVKLKYLKIYSGEQMNIFNNVTLCVAKSSVGNDYDVILHPALKENYYVKHDKNSTKKVS